MGDGPTIAAAGAALGASLLFAVGAALQHRTSSGARVTGFRPSQLADFARSVGRNPGWALAIGVEAIGVSLHAVALHLGTLVLVQPLLVSTIVFALAVRRRMDCRPVGGPELRWALVLTGGLALFLVLSNPSAGQAGRPDQWPAVALSVGCAVAVVVMVLVARALEARPRAFLLGTASGITFAGAAALIKTTGDIATSHGVAAMFTQWPFWATLVVGGTGMVLSQVALQSGPLSASLPPAQAINPLLSVLLGVVVYDEPLRHGLLPLCAQVTGLLVCLGATVVLARAEGMSARPAKNSAQAGPPGPGTVDIAAAVPSMGRALPSLTKPDQA
ncbi:MAG TPA: DMT family transporter [Acidimicrobiales bacterium]|nr:DMT family transporter [Acidimicrobiales bacterium]